MNPFGIIGNVRNSMCPHELSIYCLQKSVFLDKGMKSEESIDSMNSQVSLWKTLIRLMTVCLLFPFLGRGNVPHRVREGNMLLGGWLGQIRLAINN